MSRRHPIYIYASDEEPTEVPYYSDSSSTESSAVRPIVLSDDSSDTYVAPPPTAPVVTPTPAPSAAGTSRVPVLRRTPYPCVRDFPRGPPSPRGKAPVVDEREIPCDEQSQRRVPRLAHLEWMAPMLGRWRSLEGLPSTFETGESSRSPAPLSTTGEPVELTLPTLVSVIRTLFRISAGRGSHILELQSDVSRLDGDMIDLHERCHFLLGNMVAAREIAESARARVRVLERRARIVGLVVGACVMTAAVMAAVRMYLPWFY